MAEEKTEITTAVQAAQATEEFRNSWKGVVINSNSDYETATETAKWVKTRRKIIEDLFGPMKKKAQEAHKAIVAQEKELLKPYDEAEAAIKEAMKNYNLMLEAQKRSEEEAQKKALEDEKEKLRQEIAACEAAGDVDGAADYQATLDAIENMSTPVVIDGEKAEAKGAYTVKNWEITNIDLSKVPCEILGMVIRPVDEAVVKKLIRDSKGTIQIPGITYKETITVGIRTN